MDDNKERNSTSMYKVSCKHHINESLYAFVKVFWQAKLISYPCHNNLGKTDHHHYVNNKLLFLIQEVLRCFFPALGFSALIPSFPLATQHRQPSNQRVVYATRRFQISVLCFPLFLPVHRLRWLLSQ